MPEPTADIAALRASTSDLIKGLDEARLSDAELAAPSLCQGWTRGHVLTHLARNADGIAATLSGALRGEIVERYPDGPDARNAAIASGAGRSVGAIVTDLTEASERLDRVLGAVADVDAWELSTEDERPARVWPFWRLREVEVHRLDLDLDYPASRLPSVLVAGLLPEVAATLPARVSGPVRVTITSDESVCADLVGSTWEAGATGSPDSSGSSGSPVEVSGPDWAVLTWLVGRGTVVAAVLGDAPELAPWR